MVPAAKFLNLVFFPKRALNSAVRTQMAWLGLFLSTNVPNSYAATGIRTHINRVAPGWDLSDALPTELHSRG